MDIITAAADEHASGTNAHLLLGTASAMLVDAPMTRSCAATWMAQVGRALAGRTLTMVYVTDSHPDHMAALPIIREQYPTVPIVSRAEVAADIRVDGAIYHSRLRARMPDEIHPELLVPKALATEHLMLDDERIELIAFDGGHSAHQTALLLPDGRMLSCEVVYVGCHAYLRERRIAGWRLNLDELAALVRQRGIVQLIPSHGEPCGSDGIEQMQNYLTAIERAVTLPTRAAAEAAMRAAFPAYRCVKLLTDYTLPAFYPGR